MRVSPTQGASRAPLQGLSNAGRTDIQSGRRSCEQQSAFAEGDRETKGGSRWERQPPVRAGTTPGPIKIPGVTFLCSLEEGDTFAQGPRWLQRGWAARDPPCPQTEMLVLAGCGSLPRSSELAVRPLALN